MPYVQGTLTVTDPTAAVLTQLFTWLLADPAEHDPAQMANLIMGAAGTRSVSHQIGPGLEVETSEDSSRVTLRWERWYS